MLNESTVPLLEFIKKYRSDDNEWWRLASGDMQNLFEEAIERLDKLRDTCIVEEYQNDADEIWPHWTGR